MKKKNHSYSASGTAPAKSRKRIILFFCVYVVLSAMIVTAICCMMKPLRQRLAAYEAAQLENKSAQVFFKLFANPDWAEIYTLSGVSDTPYEGKAAYAAYMEAKVGSAELTWSEIYTGLSGIHKYNVWFGKEKIAAFTMTEGVGSSKDMPQWTLDGVEIFFERNESVIVEKRPEYTVYINGVALDDSFTIRSVTTKAEEYLPEGVHGYRLEQQYVDGLLIEPEVHVLDEHGETVAVTQDSQTGIYTLQISEPAEMTGAEAELAKNAAVADANFSMGRIKAGELRKYFDPESQVYADIVNNPIFIQKHNSFSIDEKSVEVGEFYRYSDELFSARVKLTVNVIRTDNTLKVYQLNKTYFFARSDSGDYLVNRYTNESVQEMAQQVRLRFMTDGETWTSVMVQSGADTVVVPEITAPDGKRLMGWATETENSDGTITMMVRLRPNGEVLGEMEPMTLYPVFQTMP